MSWELLMNTREWRATFNKKKKKECLTNTERLNKLSSSCVRTFGVPEFRILSWLPRTCQYRVLIEVFCACVRGRSFLTYLRTETPSGGDRVALECRFIRDVTDTPVRFGGGFQFGLISTALVQGHVMQVFVAARLNNRLVLKYGTVVTRINVGRNFNCLRGLFVTPGSCGRAFYARPYYGRINAEIDRADRNRWI